MEERQEKVLIAGGGIAGMALGLTLHQIGVPFQVFESSATMRPLGVGINVQPTAVRELFDLGLEAELDAIGVRTRDFGLYTRTGRHIWTEPRGLHAGYDWPQYSVHRGRLHMLLYDALIARAGTQAVQAGWSAVGYENQPDAAVLHLRSTSGVSASVDGALIVGADGIHSAIRAQMEPSEGEPRWGGGVLWRGTTHASPYLSGASMVMIGYTGLRFVSYPISAPDPDNGTALINWICHLEMPADHVWNKEDYSREATLTDFLPRFEGLVFDWIDCPGLIRAGGTVYEYPMVDRDPIDRWTDGRVTLTGDAAHAAYPVGSNGAGSAIIDARVLGAAFLEHGVGPDALGAFEAAQRPGASKIVLMNRTAGPDSILDIVEERCGGEFDHIDDVMPHDEMAAFSAKYKSAAGFGIAETNAAPPTIPPGARVG